MWTPVPNWVLESGGQLSRLTRTTLEWWLTKIYINKPSQQMVLCGGHVNCLINNLADSLWCFGRHKRTLQRQFSSIKMLFSQHLFFFKNLLICRLKNRYCFFCHSNVTFGGVMFYWASVVEMLSEAGLHMSAGLTNIARLASWTCELVHNPAFQHLLNRWFQWWHNCL